MTNVLVSPAVANQPLDAASEEDLAGRVQSGCNDSFAELVKRLQPRLLFALRRRLPQEADAEDVTQKTLLRAFEKIALYDPQKKFSPWLFTIAFRLATDHHRKRKLPTPPLGEATATVADPAPSAEQKTINNEQSNNLWALADRLLKPEQWSALWLFYGEDQTVKEIAQSLDRTAVSVRVLLYRARKTLAPHLASFANDAGVDNANNTDTETENEAVDNANPAIPQVVRAES